LSRLSLPRKDLEKVKDEEEWGAISVAKGLSSARARSTRCPKPRAISLEAELKVLWLYYIYSLSV